MRAALYIGLLLGLGAIAFRLGRASVRCSSGQQPVGVGRGAARALLATERAIERLKPILEPMAEGRAPGISTITRVLGAR